MLAVAICVASIQLHESRYSQACMRNISGCMEVHDIANEPPLHPNLSHPLPHSAVTQPHQATSNETATPQSALPVLIFLGFSVSSSFLAGNFLGLFECFLLVSRCFKGRRHEKSPWCSRDFHGHFQEDQREEGQRSEVHAILTQQHIPRFAEFFARHPNHTCEKTVGLSFHGRASHNSGAALEHCCYCCQPPISFSLSLSGSAHASFTTFFTWPDLPSYLQTDGPQFPLYSSSSHNCFAVITVTVWEHSQWPTRGAILTVSWHIQESRNHKQYST